MEVYLVQPRGFCAGVRRALDIVNKTLAQNGSPIYVHHEIVHNKHIIEDLEKQGVIFIDDLQEMNDKSRPLIFSAHGTSLALLRKAEDAHLKTIDAVCPLVEVVHKQIRKLEQKNIEIILVGKASHPEIIGTVGQLKTNARVHIIATLDEAKNLTIPFSEEVGVVTQTTLSVDETKTIMAYLQKQYKIVNLPKINICFATTNRQNAVRELVKASPNIIIIGSKNSSNSTHLKEAALHFGAKQAWLIDDADDLDWPVIDKCETVGISAGASAPEYLVERLVLRLKERYHNVKVHDVIIAEENINFK